MKHAYVTTERIEGVSGMPCVRDHDASVYLKVQGDALHIGGYEVNPIFWDDVQKDFSFGLFDLDWSVFSAHIQGAVNRIPAVEMTGVKATVCGPESFTPDHKPLMGEDPSLRGLWHGVGFNSSGMMLGGGCGRQLAHWVLHGRPEIDMYGYDVRRFCPRVSSDPAWVKARSHEAYAKNYSVIFPYDEPLAGRNAKKDALYDELAQNGCVFQERHGWERPGDLTTICWVKCKTASLGWFSTAGPCPPLPYDWYGAYEDTPRHANNVYEEKLRLDYNFSYPANYENVSTQMTTTAMLTVGRHSYRLTTNVSRRGTTRLYST